MRHIAYVAPLLLLVTLVTGCAKYNYDIVQPEAFRMRVGDDWQHVEAGPVQYRLRTLDNHLVILVYNTTNDPMRILGDRSYIITPDKQTIPVPTQPIGPGAYAKLILPPLEQITRPGPGITIGLGATTGRADPAPGYTDPDLSEPTYLYVDAGSTYWEWADETDVTVHLVFDQGGKTFDQTFVIRRVKV